MMHRKEKIAQAIVVEPNMAIVNQQKP